METLDDVATALAERMDTYNDGQAERARFIMEAIRDRPTTPSGTMAAWMRARHGRAVETIQLHGDGRVWIPGPREIDAERRRGAVYFGESSRDYAGTTVTGANDGALVVTTREGATILYVEAGR